MWVNVVEQPKVDVAKRGRTWFTKCRCGSTGKNIVSLR